MTGINADGFKKPPVNGRKLNRSYCNEICHNFKSNIQCRTKAKRKHGGETAKLYTKQSGV